MMPRGVNNDMLDYASLRTVGPLQDQCGTVYIQTQRATRERLDLQTLRPTEISTASAPLERWYSSIIKCA